MFAQHSIVNTGSAFGRLKVVWIDWAKEAVVTVDADDPGSDPETHVGVELERRILIEGWNVEQHEAPAFTPDHVYVGDPATKRGGKRKKHLERRDEAWAVLQPILDDDGLYDKKHRAKLVKDASKAARAAGMKSASVATITNNLLKVFHGGMVPDALRPEYEKCGAPGAPRPVKEGGKKSGPPPKENRPKGTAVTEDLKKLFRLGFDLYDTHGHIKHIDAFHHCMRVGFANAVAKLREKHGSKIPDSAYEELGLPRYDQYLYHYHRERKAWKAQIKRLGKRVYALRHRPLLKNSTDEAWGPGARYQIDATQIDVYVRSRRNRRRLLWRPTLYVVVDVWSRMIVGFALSLDPPSWIGAMTALANAMTSKPEFCAKYGIDIEDEDWPCKHLCATLEGDNGEMKSSGVLGLIKHFNVAVGNVTAYRADWKGIVERRFGLIHAMLSPHVPGFIRPDFRERGTTDYRLETAFDLDGLTQAVLICILYYNNHHCIEGYPLSPEMIADGVPAVPAEMWQWGLEHLGLPAQPNPNAVKFALLEQGSASVRRDGIYFNGATYSFQDAIDKGWFDRASMSGCKKIPISFDRRFAGAIYVHDQAAKYGFQVAEAINTERFGNTSHWELSDEQDVSKADASRAKYKETAERTQLDTALDGMRACAEAEMAKTPPATSNAAEVADIRDRTRAERKDNTVEQVVEYHDDLVPHRGPGIDASSPQPETDAPTRPIPSNENCAAPSLADRLKKRN